MDLFQYDFMLRALVGALVIGLAAPALGIYLVQRRLALIGDGIGHVALTGVGAGLLLNRSPVLVAVIAATLGAIVIELVRSRGRTSGDLALALLFYGGIAGGVMLVGLSDAGSGKLNAYLFGSLTTTSPGDLVTILVLGVAILVTMLALRPALFAVCHDEEYARVSGLPVRALNLLLAVGTAVTVTIAMRAVGVLLISAPWHGGADPVGVAYALGAGACWAAYILLTQRVGDEVSGIRGLAVSMPVAALIATVVVGPSVFGDLTWPVLLAGLGLAVLLPVVPFVLELLALRRLTTAAFGTLMSLEPAIALVVGLVALGQVPGLGAVAGIAFVVVAGIGAERTGARTGPAGTAPDGRPAPSLEDEAVRLLEDVQVGEGLDDAAGERGGQLLRGEEARVGRLVGHPGQLAVPLLDPERRGEDLVGVPVHVGAGEVGAGVEGERAHP
ncbi:hypothetical protein GCM10027452_29950 [Micromonospora halotolerans]